MVAKSYQSMTQISDPYVSSGRTYVQVRDEKTGKVRQVRWYTEKEYAKMYPDYEPEPKQQVSQKKILGFQEGYVTIFKGDTYSHLEWFQRSIARFCKLWGWYIVSTDPIPIDLPAGLTPVCLEWQYVGGEDERLLSESVVARYVDSLLYDKGASAFQGEIGERLDLVLTVTATRKGENNYGFYTIHTFEDNAGNEYVWSTGSKSWEVGAVKHIRGTVKEHKTYKNRQITYLTRCMEVK